MPKAALIIATLLTPLTHTQTGEESIMKTEILKLIDERSDRNRHDFQEGWVTREEYIAVKAEMLILQARVEEITESSSNRKDK
jgi:hypothetical protein